MTEPTASRPWADLNRMEAVERVLVESGRAMSPREMSRDLGAHGRDGDRAPLVSAALNYLARRDQVHKQARRGLWCAGPAPLLTPRQPAHASAWRSDPNARKLKGQGPFL
jgi:hypothetical protein